MQKTIKILKWASLLIAFIAISFFILADLASRTMATRSKHARESKLEKEHSATNSALSESQHLPTPNASNSALLQNSLPPNAIIISNPTERVRWPDGFAPKSVYWIPASYPDSGMVDFVLSHGDDLQIRVSPGWGFRYIEKPNCIESAINEGNGFRKLESDFQANEQIIANSFEQTLRYRLSETFSGQAILKIHPFKMEQEPEQSQPPLIQKVGALSVCLKTLQGLMPGDAEVAVEFEFLNQSGSIPLAVGLYSDAYHSEARSSLTSSDGTQFWCESAALEGIQLVNARPDHLTEISPNEKRSVLIKYKSERGNSHPATSYRVQVELVINSNYRQSTYFNYRPIADVLPPNCKAYNVLFEVPVHESK